MSLQPRRHRTLTAALSLLAVAALRPVAARAQFLDAKVVSLDGAKTMAAAAESEAHKRGWTVAIAVVDVGGELILFHRIDDVQTGSLDVAIAKARAAARFKRPTRALADAVKGNPGLVALAGVVPVAGGLPIAADGKVIGGIGVSGMSSDQDEIIAQAGLDALGHGQRTSSP